MSAKKSTKNTMKYFYVRRFAQRDGEIVDLGIVDIPETDVQETLKRNPLWRVVQTPSETAPTPAPVTEFGCPICSKQFKNASGLRLHKRVHATNN